MDDPDNPILYYILITPDDGLHVVQRQWFDTPDQYRGTFLEIIYQTEAQAKAVRDAITLSVMTQTLVALGHGL